MIELVFGVTVLALGSLFAISGFRLRGIGYIPAWFVACALLFVLLGFLSASFATHSSGIRFGLTVVSLGITSFIVGSTVGVRSPNRIGSPIGASLLSAIKADPVVDNRRLFMVAVATLGPSWLYFVLLGYVPLFEGLGAVASEGLGGLGELQASRLSRDGYASANGVRIPGQGLMQIARNIGVPMLAAYALVLIRAHGRSRTRIAILVLAITTVLLAGQRWPLVYIGIALAVATAYSEVKLPLRRVLPLGGLIVAIGVAVSVLQRRTTRTFDSWADAFQFAVVDLWGRVTEEQALVPIMSYERQTYDAGELQGQSYIDSLLAYLPGPGASFPVEFYMRVTGDNQAYTAAPDFFTEAYINFGILGVIGISAIWGFVLRFVSEMNIAADSNLSIALKSGLASVLALSCFTGPVFTISSALFAITLNAIASNVGGRPGQSTRANGKTLAGTI